MSKQLVTALLVVMLSACGSNTLVGTPLTTDSTSIPTIVTPAAPPPPSPFRRFAVDGDVWEIEHFDSLIQLKRRADVVAVATVVGGYWGMEVRHTDGNDVVIERALVLEFEIDRNVAGAPISDFPDGVEVVLDFFDPKTTELSPPVGQNAILFLRRIGGKIPGHPDIGTDQAALDSKLYRPVSSLGMVDEGSDGLEFPLGGGASWATDFLTLSWDDAIAHLESID